MVANELGQQWPQSRGIGLDLRPDLHPVVQSTLPVWQYDQILVFACHVTRYVRASPTVELSYSANILETSLPNEHYIYVPVVFAGSCRTLVRGKQPKKMTLLTWRSRYNVTEDTDCLPRSLP
jgi:hypothetical protein